jgi:anti-sigma factor RsiW
MTHAEITELLGAYALDAVSPEESLEIEQHLAECPRCRAELAAHLEVAGVLGNLGGTAPAGLWDRIADELALGSDLSSAEASRDPRSPPPPVLGELGVDDGDEDAGAPTPAPVIAIGSARSLRAVGSGGSGSKKVPERARRRYATFGVAASIAVVLAIVVGVLSAKVGNLDNQVSALSAALFNPGVAVQAVAAEGDPQHVTVHLTSADSPWSAQVVVVPGGEAFLVPGKMPAISSTQTFQAWALVGGKFVSLGVIGPSGAEMQLQPSMTEVLVNSEPQGGTSRPTTTPFISGALPKSY